LKAADAGAQRRGDAHARTPPTDPVAQIVFALVVVACFAAFFITQHLKHTPTVVGNVMMTTTFSPPGLAPEGQEGISFKLAKADEVTVTIIDSAGNTVATLVHDYPVARYKQFSLRWNGRRGFPHGYIDLKSPTGRTILLPENTGPISGAGEYRVRVSLRQQDREVLLPRSFTLVAR
jgi:hypothetical protein